VGSRSDSDSDGTVRARPGGIGTDETLSANGAVPSVPEGDLAKGEPVGEYVIEDVLGRGGFGTVYRASHPLIGKRVAIKVLSKKFSADPEMVSRFVAEAKAVNQIRHRHIIDIFSFGSLPDGRQYYVMEYLDGEPLDAYLAKHKRLELAVVVPILKAVARALDAAHAKGVAHRDLKPENIYLALDDDGQPYPKLLDFGIAKLSGEQQLAHKTNTGVPIGTPYYMSPEQCRGSGVDHRADIYSLGVVAYRLLSGTYPFDGALVDILHKHMYDEPKPPSLEHPAIEPHADAAILWMMRKDPAERPTSAVAAIAALQGEGATPSMSNVKVARSRGWIAGVLALIVAAGAAVVVFTLTRPDPPATPPKREPVVEAKIEPDAAAAATVPAIDAATVPAHVIVNVTGVPEGTEVLIGGTVVGTAPGPVQLDRGDGKVVLTFRADGRIPQSRTVTPSADQDLKLALKKKPVAGRQQPKDGGDDDVIHVFGKE
jgi:serine/threonine protein kinase